MPHVLDLILWDQIVIVENRRRCDGVHVVDGLVIELIETPLNLDAIGRAPSGARKRLHVVDARNEMISVSLRIEAEDHAHSVESDCYQSIRKDLRKADIL